MGGYIIIRKVIHEGDFSVAYSFLAGSENEALDADNKEQRGLTLVWRADHKRIKHYLQTSYSVDALIGNLILECRLVHAEMIRNIKKSGTKEQVKEMLAYMDGFIMMCIEQNQ